MGKGACRLFLEREPYRNGDRRILPIRREEDEVRPGADEHEILMFHVRTDERFGQPER